MHQNNWLKLHGHINCSNIQLTDTIISVQTTTDVSMFINNSSSIVNRNWIINCVTSKKIYKFTQTITKIYNIRIDYITFIMINFIKITAVQKCWNMNDNLMLFNKKTHMITISVAANSKALFKVSYYLYVCIFSIIQINKK